MKKQTWLEFFGVVITMLACTVTTLTSPTATPADRVGTVVAETMQAYTASPSESPSTQDSTQVSGAAISFENVSFVIPKEVASDTKTDKMAPMDTNSGAPWEIAPTHLRFILSGYPVQGKFHEPAIFIYPADEYARANPGAAEQLDRLKKIRTGATLLRETLPTVPSFNATPLIAANIKLITFQGGSGVRFLTQYDQYPAPVNNRELFYHFQGLTDDDKYYIIAILPVTATILAEDEKPEASVPSEGVPIPTSVGPNDVYYISVTEKLNSLSSDSYTPALDALDRLIQSLLVSTP